MTSAEVAAQISSALKDSSLVFVAPEAERALGLIDFLENYSVVSNTKDSLLDELASRSIGKYIHSTNGTAGILNTSEFTEFLATKGKAYLQFFKPTADTYIDKEVKILNNSTTLTRTLENKLTQLQMFSNSEELKKYVPPSKVAPLSSLNYQDLVSEFAGFVVQLPFGHTGNSTYIFPAQDKAADEDALTKLQKEFPQRQCKVSKKVDGYPLTVNSCLYRGQTYTAGLSYQFTGIPALTGMAAATVGNDWAITSNLVPPEIQREVITLTEEVGKILAKDCKFRGLFGLDLIYSATDNKLYLIELNPRQVASVSFLSRLQSYANEVSLSMLHLAEFLDLQLALGFSAQQYSLKNLSSYSAAQLLLRVKNQSGLTLPLDKEVINGFYRQQADTTAEQLIKEGKIDNVIFLDSEHDRPMILQKAANYFNDQTAVGALLTVKNPGLHLEHNAEIARVQADFGFCQYNHLSGQEIRELQILPLPLDLLAIISTMLGNENTN